MSCIGNSDALLQIFRSVTSIVAFSRVKKFKFLHLNNQKVVNLCEKVVFNIQRK